jgi:hypothetical protein
VADTIATRPPPPADHRGKARWTLARLRRLSGCERDFLDAMAEQTVAPTERQQSWLDALARRAAACGRQ